MSITSQEYEDWCDRVSHTNKLMDELWDSRRKNYKWMADNLREFFGEMGKVISVKASNDGSIFRIRMAGTVDLDSFAFCSLPFPFKVAVDDETMDLMFYLYPGVGESDY